MIEPTLVRTGELIPIWYDSADMSRDAPVPRSVEGLAIPSYTALHQAIKGHAPSGPQWDAFRTILDVNSTLQRLIALPPGSPKAAAEALRAAVLRLNQDKEFAAESIRTIEFAPDYETSHDIAVRVRGMLVASPQVRAFVADYIRGAQKR